MREDAMQRPVRRSELMATNTSKPPIQVAHKAVVSEGVDTASGETTPSGANPAPSNRSDKTLPPSNDSSLDYVCNACGLPLPLRLPLPGEVASSWECRYCGNRFYATLMDDCPPEVLTNVRPAQDVHPRIAIGGHVLAELHKRDGRPGRGFEERQFPRVSTDIALSVSIEGFPISSQTLDISAGGLSFVSPQKAEAGEQFTARFESIPGRPTARCVVRNCAEIRPGIYRLGAEFLSGDAGPMPQDS